MTDQHRTPPQDVAAEAALLGACLLHPQAIHDASTLIAGPEFWRPDHEAIWQALQHCLATGQPTNPIAVTRQLNADGNTRADNGAYLFELHTQADGAAVTQAAYYAGIIREHYDRRQVDATSMRLTQAAYSPGFNRDELKTFLRQQLEALDQDIVGNPERADPRLIPGGDFLLADDTPTTPIWGMGEDILWIAGESLILAGPSGVGKTTLAQQVVLARFGIRPPAVLGLPVTPSGRGLYFAMDRPMQVRRSLRRMVRPEHHHALNQALTVWKGPPPEQVVANPRVLLQLAQRAGLHPGDFVVIDSVKDVAVGIAKDDVGAAVNQALQELLAAEIDVLALHHVRKGETAGVAREPERLDEIYGSSHITNGSGSVVSVWGQPGDPLVSFRHLKPVAGIVGPWQIAHDHTEGVTTVAHEVDIVELVKWQRESGLTAGALAVTLYRIEDREPTEAEIARARRKLDALVRSGVLVRRDADTEGRGGRGKATAWLLAAFASSGRGGE